MAWRSLGLVFGDGSLRVEGFLQLGHAGLFCSAFPRVFAWQMDVKNPQTFHLVLNNGARGQASQSPSQPPSLPNGPTQSPPSPSRRPALSSTPPPPSPQTFLPESSLSSTSREDELAQSSREVAVPLGLLPSADTRAAGLSPPPEALLGRASPTPIVATGEATSTTSTGGWFSVSSSSGSEGLRRRRPESLSTSHHDHQQLQSRPTQTQGHAEPPSGRVEGGVRRALTAEEVAWYRHYYHAQHMAARAAQDQLQVRRPTVRDSCAPLQKVGRRRCLLWPSLADPTLRPVASSWLTQPSTAPGFTEPDV